MPLSEALETIADRIVGFYDRGSSAPFVVYQYDPADEYKVRQELKDLKLALESPQHDIKCRAVSLAEIFWETLEEHGQLQMVIDAERAGAYDDAHTAVGEILSNRPTLADRIVKRVVDEDADRSAIFLYRASALYPAHRTGSLLDALKDKINRPVTLLYPGRIVGDYGLSFMGKTEPTYGYRALIVPRGGKQ